MLNQALQPHSGNKITDHDPAPVYLLLDCSVESSGAVLSISAIPHHIGLGGLLTLPTTTTTPYLRLYRWRK